MKEQSFDNDVNSLTGMSNSNSGAPSAIDKQAPTDAFERSWDWDFEVRELGPDETAECKVTMGADDLANLTVDGEERLDIGYLSIPSIGLELPVMSQWSYAGLKIAPGRYSGSTYADNMVVCAHNYAKHFSPIKWLTEGAQVYFTDMDGMRWTYEVSYVENLQPTQIEEMTEKTEESDEWDLTLFTCTTGGSARCAVRCVRTGYPALTTETAE